MLRSITLKPSSKLAFRCLFPLLLFVLIRLPVTAQQPTFSRIASLPVGNTPALALPGDFNGDGKMDIATVNIGVNDGQTITVHFNSGSGVFSASTTISLPFPIGGRGSVADFNNDGKADIVVLGISSFVVCLSQGTTFQQITIPHPDMPAARVGSTSLRTSNTEYGIVAADFDGNGFVDIASNGLNGGAFILLNSGAANFNQVVRVPFSGASVMGLLSSGDFNNDNKPDICFIQRELSYPNPLFAAVLTNNGFANNTVTFTTRTPVSLLAPDIHSGMICADFNGDGNLDAAVSVWTAGTYQGQLAVRFGNGTGNLSGSTNLPVTLTIQEAGFTPLTVPCTADFNADNKMDIAVVQYPSTQASSVKIFLGDGAGNFPTSSELSLGGSARFISTADFTGDGQTDFAVSQAPSTNQHHSNSGYLR